MKSHIINTQHKICILYFSAVPHLIAVLDVKQKLQTPTKGLRTGIIQYMKTNLCLLLVRVHILVKTVMEDLDTCFPQRHNICFLSLSQGLSHSPTYTLTGSLWDRIELSLAQRVSYYSGLRVKQMKITRGEIQLPFRVLYLKGSFNVKEICRSDAAARTQNDGL